MINRKNSQFTFFQGNYQYDQKKTKTFYKIFHRFDRFGSFVWF